ncbi:hypothetical protein ACWDBW_01435 [Streptomyces sp. NPDC001107]
MDLATAPFGLAPRAATAAWAVFGLCLVIGVLDDVLDLPNRLLGVSPFQHLPQRPPHHMTAATPPALTTVAASLPEAGLAGFRRRGIGQP